MNEKTHQISAGQEFVHGLLLNRLGSEIEGSGELSDEQKVSLLSKLEEGKVYPSHDTELKLLSSLATQTSEIQDLTEELCLRKEKIDFLQKPNLPRQEREKVCTRGSYFFVSAVIALLNIALPVVKKGEVDRKLLTV